MVVPKGKTLYVGKKVMKAGDEIPASLESKFAKILNKENKQGYSLSKKDDFKSKADSDK